MACKQITGMTPGRVGTQQSHQLRIGSKQRAVHVVSAGGNTYQR
jgi:hypothetical protein